MLELTPSQKSAITSDEGVFVLAGAGSGKTFIITQYVKRLLNQSRKGWIIVLTFSNKAAQELKTRIQNHEKYLFIGTIHSFYYEFLPNKKEILSDLEEKIYYEHSVQNYIKKNSYLLTRKYYYEELLRSYLKNRFKVYSSQSYHQETEDLLKDFHDFYLQEKKDKLSFDELEYLAGEYSWDLPVEKFIVDEFQDTSLKQLEIFIKIVSDPKKFFFVGDFKQSIYGFRGGGVREHPLFQSLKTIYLEENFRSDEKIVQYANNIFPHEPQKVIHFYDGFVKEEGDLEEFLILKGTKAILFRTLKNIHLVKDKIKNISYEEQKRYYLAHDPYILLYEEILLFQKYQDESLFLKRLNYYQEYFQIEFNLPLKYQELSSQELYNDLVHRISLLSPLSDQFNEILPYLNLSNIGYIKEQYATFPVGEAELNLMTIHGSKGLEFDYVFLYDILKPFRKAPLNYYLGQGAFRYYDEEGIFQKTQAFLEEEKRRQNKEEDQRLFYVAMTRAKKGLFLNPF